MKLRLTIIFLALSINLAYTQKILLLEKPGFIDNTKYRVGDRIELSTVEKIKVSGIISNIGDSLIVINYLKIKISDIKYIYTSRVFLKIISGVGLQGGLAYTGIDFVNNLINNETPYMRNSALKTGGYTFGIGIIASFFSENKRKVDGKKWRIKILDFDK